MSPEFVNANQIIGADMTDSKNTDIQKLSLDEKFSLAINSFSANLSDLRDFSELIESLIKKHKLNELEAAIARYKGLGEALCKFDTELESDINSIQKECVDELSISELFIEFNVGADDKGEKYLSVSGPKELVREFDKSIGSILKTDNSVQHLQRSSLISLVSVVESFLSQLLHIFFQKNPSAVNAKEKQFTLEELSNFSSLDDARAYIVSWKIENLLRGSYEDWIDYFRSQVKIELSVAKKHHDRLVENFQRRNLFVHNDGVVNKIYLSKVAPSLSKPEMLNKRLGVSKRYLLAAIDRFESTFIQLAFELWKKCDKHSTERPSLIIQTTYDALQNKRWLVVTEIAEFVKNDKAASEADILMAKINSLIARKKIEDKSKFLEEVNAFDVSAKNDLFKLAKHCLLEENDLALILAKRLQKAKMLTLDCLVEWPIFEDLRATPEMAKWLQQLKSKFTKQSEKKALAAKCKLNTTKDSVSIVQKKARHPKQIKAKKI